MSLTRSNLPVFQSNSAPMMDFASPPHRRSLLDVAISRLGSCSRKRVIHPYVDSPPANGNLEGAHVARLRSSFTRFSLVENSSLFLSANDPRRRLTAAAQTLRGRENRMHLQSSISVPWPQRPKPSPAVSAYYKQSKYTTKYVHNYEKSWSRSIITIGWFPSSPHN